MELSGIMKTVDFDCDNMVIFVIVHQTKHIKFMNFILCKLLSFTYFFVLLRIESSISCMLSRCYIILLTFCFEGGFH